MRTLGAAAAVLVAVSWGAAARAGTPAVYTGTSGNWNVGSKWSTNPTVPLDGGGNLYDVSISNVTVTYNIAGSNAVESLGLTGATLNLSSGDSLSVVSGLTASKSTISASNAAFSAGGTTTIDSTNLTATSGGTINVPVTTFTATQGTTWQASGSGSVVELPDLTSVSYGGTSLTVSAQSGGVVELPALTGLSATGTLYVSATGTGSQVNLSALGTAVSGLNITTSGGGTVNWGSPTTVQASSITLDAASTLNTAALTNIDSTSITVEGPGTFSFPLITAISTLAGTGPTLEATNGATLNLAAVTTVTNPGDVFSGVLFLATGAGSKVTANAVTTITNNASGIEVEAQSGGYLEMTALTSVNNLGSIFGSFTASADGANSKVELPALTTIHLVGQSDTISATNGGTVDAHLLATVTTTGNGFEALSIQSTGAGSVVHVPLLGNSAEVLLQVTVGTGGTVLWGSPTVVQASSITVQDPTGVIAVGQLTNIDSTSLTASGGATINLPLVTAYSAVIGTGATIQANAGSTITLPAVQTITNPGNIFDGLTFSANGTGAKVSMDAVTTVTSNAASITFEAEGGGLLEMTGLKAGQNLGSIFGNFNAYADGAGSRVSMPALTTLQLFGQTDNLRATAGGYLDMHSLKTVTSTGNIFENLSVQSTGAGSVVDVSGLLSTVAFPDSFAIGSGGEVLFGALTGADYLSFNAEFTNATGSLDIYLDGSLFTSIAANNVNTVEAYGFYFNGPGVAQPEFAFVANGANAAVTVSDYLVVPEPGALALVGLGCGVLLRRRRCG